MRMEKVRALVEELLVEVLEGVLDYNEYEVEIGGYSRKKNITIHKDILSMAGIDPDIEHIKMLTGNSCIVILPAEKRTSISNEVVDFFENMGIPVETIEGKVE